MTEARRTVWENCIMKESDGWCVWCGVRQTEAPTLNSRVLLLDVDDDRSTRGANGPQRGARLVHLLVVLDGRPPHVGTRTSALLWWWW